MHISMKELDRLHGVYTVHFSRAGWTWGDGPGTWNHAQLTVRAQNRKDARHKAWREFHRVMKRWGPLAKKDGWQVLAVQTPTIPEYVSVGIFVKYAS